MESNNIQHKFLTHIQQLIAPKSLANELQGILDLSQSGAYRRIRCETPLTIEDIAKEMVS